MLFLFSLIFTRLETLGSPHLVPDETEMYFYPSRIVDHGGMVFGKIDNEYTGGVVLFREELGALAITMWDKHSEDMDLDSMDFPFYPIIDIQAGKTISENMDFGLGFHYSGYYRENEEEEINVILFSPRIGFSWFTGEEFRVDLAAKASFINAEATDLVNGYVRKYVGSYPVEINLRGTWNKTTFSSILYGLFRIRDLRVERETGALVDTVNSSSMVGGGGFGITIGRYGGFLSIAGVEGVFGDEKNLCLFTGAEVPVRRFLFFRFSAKGRMEWGEEGLEYTTIASTGFRFLFEDLSLDFAVRTPVLLSPGMLFEGCETVFSSLSIIYNFGGF
ncbi:hypothetical protein DRQ18_07150 [bacterium]|nr:MAG: hypothetical protein DRQ18_07150 [bacterium]